jgi:hypothetical protein
MSPLSAKRSQRVRCSKAPAKEDDVMNMVAWWFVIMILSWLLTALILWKTTIVISGEEGVSGEEERVENE